MKIRQSKRQVKYFCKICNKSFGSKKAFDYDSKEHNESSKNSWNF